MFIKDVNNYDNNSDSVAEEFLASGRKKEIQSAIESIIEDEFYRLEEYATDHISQIAARRATEFLKKVLAGDEDAAKQLFGGCTDRDRYRSLIKREPWASLIHGSLFETDSITLRRKLVEQHADLLKTERIKDLESIVEGLSKQVRNLEADLNRCHERL